MTVDELNKLLNAHGAPCFEAVANTGQGVFPTLKALAARVLETIHTGARPGAPTMSAGPLPTPAPAAAPAPAPAAAGTGYGARPLHQTGYTPVVPGAAAHAPGQNSAPPRHAVPVGAQALSPQPQIPMQRGTIHSGTDSIPRSALHAPQAPAGQAPAPISMQSTPVAPGAGPQIVRGHPNPAPMGAPTPGAAPNLMMQRQESSAAPAAAPRPAPTAPMRPPARPAPARPAAARPAAARPVQPRPIAPKIATVTKPKKKSLTTVMLVVAALIAGAVMAVAVLS